MTVVLQPSDQTSLLSAGEELARALLEDCPRDAESFARAQQEKACWGYDQQRLDLWDHVVVALSRLRAASPAPPTARRSSQG